MTRALVFLLAMFSCACSLNFGGGEFPAQQEHRQAQQSLDSLIGAYRDQDISRFGELISERYTGERSDLELRVQRDFSAFFDIDIRYTLNNTTTDGRGRVSMAITFNRTYTEKATGDRLRQSGEARFVFIREGGRYRLLTQQPALFGISG